MAGANAKFSNTPKEKARQSLVAMPKLWMVMVKPMAAIMMTMRGALNPRRKSPGADVTSPQAAARTNVPEIT